MSETSSNENETGSESSTDNRRSVPNFPQSAKMAKGSPVGAQPGALEVHVDSNGNVEKAMKILKRKLIKEGLFKELKSRRYYEKPSERRKRKKKESLKKIRKDEARRQKNQLLS